MANTPEQVIMKLRGNLQDDLIDRVDDMKAEIVRNTPVRSGNLKASWTGHDLSRTSFGRSRDFATNKTYRLFTVSDNDAVYGQYVRKLHGKGGVIDKAIKNAFSN